MYGYRRHHTKAICSSYYDKVQVCIYHNKNSKKGNIGLTNIKSTGDKIGIPGVIFATLKKHKNLDLEIYHLVFPLTYMCVYVRIRQAHTAVVFGLPVHHF